MSYTVRCYIHNNLVIFIPTTNFLEFGFDFSFVIILIYFILHDYLVQEKKIHTQSTARRVLYVDANQLVETREKNEGKKKLCDGYKQRILWNT